MARLIKCTPALNRKEYTRFLNNVFSNENKKAPKKDMEIGRYLCKKIQSKPMFG